MQLSETRSQNEKEKKKVAMQLSVWDPAGVSRFNPQYQKIGALKITAYLLEGMHGEILCWRTTKGQNN